MTRFFLVIFLSFWMANAVHAQQAVWVQVEAQPTLIAAQSRARAYASQMDNVAGYYLGSGWYGIVLGPYTRPDAQRLMQSLRQGGSIPGDSFIAFERSFRQQFWPVGVGAETTAQPLPDLGQANETEVASAQDTVIDIAPALPLIAIPDETKREARASEGLLTSDERKDLQIALQWAGFYNSSIDGAFGRGTRRSMGEWQAANNNEATGILTTGQRSELLQTYNAVLDGMFLRLVRDDAAGIEMQIPTGVVAFAEYEPPFARFDAKGDLAAQVLLISQAGDQNRLFGLYEILQTLAIVPPEGDRTRRNSSFEIEGIGADVHSYTMARLERGTIKGFSLIWPAGDDERRRRVLQEMKDSFNAIDGVLDPSLTQPGEDQAIDLVAGLAVRKPQMSRSGFYIGHDGTVLTTAEAIGECSELTINSEHAADLVFLDEDLGIAVLRPKTPLSPLDVVAFQTAVPRLQSEIAVAGFPYGGVLTTPALTFGRLADIRGLNGEKDVKRLALIAQPGDAGGPVFDNGGAVLGMLLPKSDVNGQQLPAEVSFSVDSDEILAALLAAGIVVETTDTVAFMAPETLTQRAADQTVLVSCW